MHRDIHRAAPQTPDELVHPYLGAAASVFSRWAGREVFHAGAFICGGLAWAVVGGREAGKSSLLAALAARQLPVLADDLVITDGQDAFCGPRTIDLRRPIPGSSEPVTPARGASRWRVSLPPLCRRGAARRLDLPALECRGGHAGGPGVRLAGPAGQVASLARAAVRSRDAAGARRPAPRGTSNARLTGPAWTRRWT